MSVHILVVDDDPNTVQRVHQLRAGHGYQVLGTADIQQALDLSADDHKTIAIVAYFLHSDDASAFLREIMEGRSPGLLGLIVLTAGTSVLPRKSVFDVAKKLGADAVLPKPLIIGGLLPAIQKMTEGVSANH